MSNMHLPDASNNNMNNSEYESVSAQTTKKNPVAQISIQKTDQTVESQTPSQVAVATSASFAKS